jgi:hypothetical protein
MKGLRSGLEGSGVTLDGGERPELMGRSSSWVRQRAGEDGDSEGPGEFMFYAKSR